MKLNKIAVSMLLLMLVFTFAVFAGGDDEKGGGSKVASDIDYDSLSWDELYELAKQESGVIKVYATTTDASSAIRRFKTAFPELKDKIEYISCDNDTVASKIEMECDTGNINADVMQVKDNSGEIYHELVLYDYISIYRPEVITKHIDESLLEFGLPLYATFNPWYYNTKMYPNGAPIKSWWDIVQGYDPETGSYVGKDGVNHQFWTIFTKDITGPSYASLWCQLIIDADKLEKQYEAQYGKKLEYTYTSKLKNVAGIMELPENNAGVELFYRFTQMKMTELNDGDGVVDAVDQSINGPTLGLTSASKLDNADMGMNIAWVIGLEPYTAFKACSYSYVVNGTDNPAGARLYIMYCMGGEDGKSGCYTSFDKRGTWSVRDDIVYEKNGKTVEQVKLTEPDFNKIYETYPNVTAYWKYWRSLAN